MGLDSLILHWSLFSNNQALEGSATMKIVKRIALVLILACVIGVILDVGYGIFACEGFRMSREKNNQDCAMLRSIHAEAYINIHEDPYFVNAATYNQPMEVPEKYYTYAESEQGHGRVHVVAFVDGDVEAYFGTSEKTVAYYSYGEGRPKPPKLPPISNAVVNVVDYPLMLPFGCSIIALTVGLAVYYLIHLAKKRNPNL